MYQEVLRCIRSRRSVRRFAEEQIEDNQLNAILEAATWAPSGSNNQTWLFTAVQNKDVLTKINEALRQGFLNWTPDDEYPAKKKAVANAQSGTHHYFYHAPTLIIASNVPNYQNGMADCATALQNIFLAATSLGLGSCWINQPRWLTNDPALRKLLASIGLPERHILYGAAAIGHPARIPPAPERKKGTVNIVR
jgi:nitroreductase